MILPLCDVAEHCVATTVVLGEVRRLLPSAVLLIFFTCLRICDWLVRIEMGGRAIRRDDVELTSIGVHASMRCSQSANRVLQTVVMLVRDSVVRLVGTL